MPDSRILFPVPSLLTLLCLVVATPAPALLDCPAGTVPVDDLYREDDEGSQCLVWNRFNFVDPNGDRIILSDPTVLELDGQYYVTGTTEDGSFYDMANFPIYRSADLISWELFGTAFPESQRTGDLLELNPHPDWPPPPKRAFCWMWAPELYVDPLQPEVIWMTFTAVENRGHGPGMVDNLCDGYQGLHPTRGNSVYVVSVDRADFLAGGHFADPTSGRSAEPRWFAYSNGGFKYDGGESLSPPPRTVPTTVSIEQLDYPQSGKPTLYGKRWCHERGDLTPTKPAPGEENWKYCSTWMALDSFSFLDPNTNRRWALYTWSVVKANDLVWNGNHVAAHPLVGGILWPAHAVMDVSDPDGHLPLAYRQGSSNAIPPVDPADPPIPNGCVAGSGGQTADCVAEAPAVFFHPGTGFYYLLISRNPFGAPAYGIFYRKADTFEKLGLGAWDDGATAELPLLTARDRSAPRGPSYGHGEIFLGPGDRPYLVFHAKDPGSTRRTVYFKELTFQGDGTILPLTEAADAGPSGIDRRRDLRLFVIPRPGLSSGTPGGGDPGES